MSPFNARFLPMSMGKDFVPDRFLFWKPKDDSNIEKNEKIEWVPPNIEPFSFRSGPVDFKKDPNVFRVIILGGSNAWGSSVENYEDTFTSLLEKMIKSKFPNRKFEFICAGTKAFRLFQNLVLYKLLIRHYNPDLIILYGNVNDRELFEGPYTFRELFLMRTGVDIGRLWIDEFEFPKSRNVVSKFQDNFQKFRTYNAMVLWIRDIRDEFWPADKTFKVVKDVNPPEDYEKNLNDFITILEKDGVRLLLADAFQAPWCSPDSPRGRFTVLMKEVAMKREVPFVPVNEILNKQQDANIIFPHDPVHINEKGHKLVSKILFDALLENNLFKK